jgi:hypothetical protein
MIDCKFALDSHRQQLLLSIKKDCAELLNLLDEESYEILQGAIQRLADDHVSSLSATVGCFALLGLAETVTNLGRQQAQESN